MISILAIALVLAILLLLCWFRANRGALVDGARVWVNQDTHCTALIHYREGKQSVRLNAEVGARPYPMTVFLTEKLYTDEGELLSSEQARVVVDRMSRGLDKLKVSHEFEGQLCS